MTLWKSLSASFLSALRQPRLWLVQFFGNVVLFLVFIWWLNIPPSNGFNVFLNVIVAMFFIVAFLLLHGGTLNYFSDLSENMVVSFGAAFKKALKHLPAFAISVALFCVLLWLVLKLDNYLYSFPGYLRSEFPAWLRRLISENALDNIYAGFIYVLCWVFLPGLLLPFGLLCADKGFRGVVMLGAWQRTVRNWAYWIVLILAALIGVYCTGKIMGWLLDPRTASLTGEKVWLSFRMFVAYLLALLSWFWVCSMLARARPHPEPPAESQKAAA